MTLVLATIAHWQHSQRRKHERLPEPTRTGEKKEIVHLVRDETVEIRRFVDVNSTLPDESGKIARRCRYRFHLRVLYRSSAITIPLDTRPYAMPCAHFLAWKTMKHRHRPAPQNWQHGKHEAPLPQKRVQLRLRQLRP